MSLWNLGLHEEIVGVEGGRAVQRFMRLVVNRGAEGAHANGCIRGHLIQSFISEPLVLFWISFKVTFTAMFNRL